jgi:serine/threonine protein kinase
VNTIRGKQYIQIAHKLYNVCFITRIAPAFSPQVNNKHLYIFIMAKKQNLQDYNVGVTLGTGSFGRVRFATDMETGACYAIKMLKKIEVVRLEQIEHIQSEKAILESLDFPYIVKMSGTFQDQLYLYMVLEYIVGGEFFTHLRKKGRFDNATSRFYASQIVMVFEYIHNLDIIYRDLKPENLLLDKVGYLKITDFGFAKKVPDKTYTLCGTPEYIAPEVLLNKGHGKPVDWWTLGILVFESLHGQYVQLNHL